MAAAAAAGPVDYVASSIGAPAAQLLPGVDRVITFDAPWILDPAPGATEATIAAFVDSIDGGAYSGAAILTSSHQSALPTALLLGLAGVARIAAVSHDYPGSLLDHRIKGDPDVHEVKRSLAVMEQLGFEGDPQPHLRIALEPGEPIGGRVVVHPGAPPCPRARWSRAAGHAASSRSPATATTWWSPAATRNTTSLRWSPSPWIIRRSFLARSDLRGLAEVLATAAVVVTGNTGPAHLAAAVGRPVVSVFPPTVPPSRWAPWGVPHVLLGDPLVARAGCRVDAARNRGSGAGRRDACSGARSGLTPERRLRRRAGSPMTLRIALVSEHASPLAVHLGTADAGGQNVYVDALARHLARAGAVVDVYTRGRPRRRRRSATSPPASGSTTSAGPPEPIPKDDLFDLMPEFARRLSDAWRRRPPDVVHAHFWMSGWASQHARRRHRVPLVQTFHALGVVKRRHQGSADTSPADRGPSRARSAAMRRRRNRDAPRRGVRTRRARRRRSEDHGRPVRRTIGSDRARRHLIPPGAPVSGGWCHARASPT